MMAELGAMATVRALINRPNPDEFVCLRELNSLDLSIEAYPLAAPVSVCSGKPNISSQTQRLSLADLYRGLRWSAAP